MHVCSWLLHAGWLLLAHVDRVVACRRACESPPVAGCGFRVEWSLRLVAHSRLCWVGCCLLGCCQSVSSECVQCLAGIHSKSQRNRVRCIRYCTIYQRKGFLFFRLNLKVVFVTTLNLTLFRYSPSYRLSVRTLLIIKKGVNDKKSHLSTPFPIFNRALTSL